MTEKQEQILLAALELFAKNGFDGTSTSKIAQKAQVSEGLIFRHFTNKDGLLQAILLLGKQKAEAAYSAILTIEAPKEQLRKIISLPFITTESEYNFWRLLYSLKWQSSTYDYSITKVIREIIHSIFTQLKYSNPEAETETLMIIIDGSITSLLLRNPSNKNEVLQTILNKYSL